MALTDDHWPLDGPLPADLSAPPDAADAEAAAELFTPGVDPETIPADDQVWRIDDERGAEWALRKLARAEAHLDEIHLQAEEWTRRITEWAADVKAGPERDAAFFRAHLEWWARRRRDEDPDAKSVRLPSGEVSTRETRAAVEIADPAAVLAWARDRYPDLVRVREDVQVSTLRGAVAISDDGHVRTSNEAGDEVPGVAVRPASISVSVKVER